MTGTTFSLSINHRCLAPPPSSPTLLCGWAGSVRDWGWGISLYGKLIPGQEWVLWLPLLLMEWAQAWEMHTHRGQTHQGCKDRNLHQYSWIWSFRTPHSLVYFSLWKWPSCLSYHFRAGEGSPGRNSGEIQGLSIAGKGGGLGCRQVPSKLQLAARLQGETLQRGDQASLCFTRKTKHNRTGIWRCGGSHTLVTVATLSPGKGYWKATEGRFCCKRTAKEPVSGSECPVALRIHGTQSPPKLFLMGGVISIFQAEKPRAEGKLALFTLTPPPPLAGSKRGPGLLLPNPSFISHTVLPLGAFWRGPCCGNEHLSKLWSLAFKGLSNFPPGVRSPPCLMPPAHGSPHCQGSLPVISCFFESWQAFAHTPNFPFLPVLFSFFIWILDNTWDDFLL